jgi:hypothetical protein
MPTHRHDVQEDAAHVVRVRVRMTVVVVKLMFMHVVMSVVMMMTMIMAVLETVIVIVIVIVLVRVVMRGVFMRVSRTRMIVMGVRMIVVMGRILAVRVVVCRRGMTARLGPETLRSRCKQSHRRWFWNTGRDAPATGIKIRSSSHRAGVLDLVSVGRGQSSADMPTATEVSR